MNIPMETKKQEAIKRMKTLGIFTQTIKQFQGGLVSYSEGPLGANYWIDEEQQEVVKAFEKEHDALVYFAIRSYTEFGKLDAFLYVSDNEEDWEVDNADLKSGYAFAYVHNYDEPSFSDFGSIGIQGRFGGLVRTA